MMVIMILLIVALPVISLITAYLVLKAVQLGLRWQIQTNKQETPTMDAPISIPNPLAKKEAAPIVLNDQILDEWLNGEKVK